MADKKFVVALQGEDNLSPVVDKAGKSLQGLTREAKQSKDALETFYEENRRGERTLNFAISQGREAFAGLTTAVAVLGVAGSGASKEMKDLTDAVGKGIIAFQGFENLAGLFGLGGPWGLAIGGIAGVVTALLEFNDTSEETEARLAEQKKLIEEVDKAYNAWLERLKGTEEANKIATRAEMDATKERMRVMDELMRAQEEGRAAMFATDREAALAQRVQTELGKKNLVEWRAEYERLGRSVEAYGRALLTTNEVEVTARAARKKDVMPEKLLPSTVDFKVADRNIRALGDVMKKDISFVEEKHRDVADDTKAMKIRWEEVGAVQQVEIQALQSGIYSVANAIGSEVSKAWEDAFGTANSLLEIFLQNMLTQLATGLASKLGGSILSGIFSIFPGGGVIGEFLGGLFHAGGTVPRAHGGAYVNANPNREFPILVRGGETIRTEDQEKELQSMVGRGSGTSITLNVGTAIGGRQFVRDALAELRRQTGLSIDALTQDRSATVRLAVGNT